MPADSANQPEVAAVEGVAQASFSQSPTGPGTSTIFSFSSPNSISHSFSFVK